MSLTVEMSNKKLLVTAIKSFFTTITQVLLIIIITVAILVGFFHFVFYQRIYPEIFIANVYVGGLTKDEAVVLLKNQLSIPPEITIEGKEKKFILDPSSIDFNYNYDTSVQSAYLSGRNYPFYKNILSPLLLVLGKNYLPINFSFDEEKLKGFVSDIASVVNKNAKKPTVKLVNGSLFVDRGISGELLDERALTNKIKENFSNGTGGTITITTTFDDTQLTQEQADILQNRAENLLNKALVLGFEYDIENITKASLLTLLGTKGGYDLSEIDNFIDVYAGKIERDPQNPIFTFENGTVKEFQPAKEGVKIQKLQFRNQIVDALEKLENTEDKVVNISPPVEKTPSQLRTENVNNLGIKELLGRGSSKYAGSISSRIHNIALASSKFKGILVAPGDTFSFNTTLGDVSKETGYEQAYIIKEGSTILGDGGGVCQVSTTLFRAALKAGLPIVERRAHAYRVGYYEQDSPPGFDATVYAPSPDLKFKNDTPAYILIQATANTKAKTLVFEIYGTSDSRISVTTKPTVKDIVPPPEDLYTDDPSLPTGTVKQIDWKASGAKVSFKYTVTRNSEIIYEKTFTSNYQPWQAKFLRGTGIVN